PAAPGVLRPGRAGQRGRRGRDRPRHPGGEHAGQERRGRRRADHRLRPAAHPRGAAGQPPPARRGRLRGVGLRGTGVLRPGGAEPDHGPGRARPRRPRGGLAGPGTRLPPRRVRPAAPVRRRARGRPDVPGSLAGPVRHRLAARQADAGEPADVLRRHVRPDAAGVVLHQHGPRVAGGRARPAPGAGTGHPRRGRPGRARAVARRGPASPAGHAERLRDPAHRRGHRGDPGPGRAAGGDRGDRAAGRAGAGERGEPAGAAGRGRAGHEMTGRHLLAIDDGTGSCRAVLFTEAGEQAGVGQREWTHHEPPGVPGGQDFDVRAGWQAIAACVRDALSAAGATGDDVAAVAATSMREGMVLYDAAGHEIFACPNVDSRASAEAEDPIREGAAEKIYAEAGDWVSITAPARLRWLGRHRPDILAATASLGMLSDWIVYRLTGQHVTEPSCGSSSGMFTLAARRWSPTIPELCGLPAAALPPVADPGTVVGEVIAAAAELTGLRPGTPVAAGGGDTQLGLLGTGAKRNEYTVVAGTF